MLGQAPIFTWFTCSKSSFIAASQLSILLSPCRHCQPISGDICCACTNQKQSRHFLSIFLTTLRIKLYLLPLIPSTMIDPSSFIGDHEGEQETHEKTDRRKRAKYACVICQKRRKKVSHHHIFDCSKNDSHSASMTEQAVCVRIAKQKEIGRAHV